VSEDVIDDLGRKSAGGVVLGWIEIPLIVRQESCRVPLFDATALQTRRALEMGSWA
jgi:aspartate/glutamate racemase